MTTLYVLTHGAILQKRHRSLLVKNPQGQTLQNVQLRHLRTVFILPWVKVTSPALAALLKNGVDLALLRPNGKFLGRLTSPRSPSHSLHRIQYQLFTAEDKLLKLAEDLIAAKLANQEQLLRYLAWHSESPQEQPFLEAAENISRLASSLPSQQNLDSLRGTEGAAARWYWQAFAAALANNELGFSRRVYRPATDPVNAALSFGYALLTTHATGYVEGMGMDPYVGFFHAPAPGRPSLALDLIEPFRAPLVDRLVLRLFNLRILAPDDFHKTSDGAVRLTDPARKRFLKEFEMAFTRSQLREALQAQMEQLTQFLRHPNTPMSFFRWRPS